MNKLYFNKLFWMTAVSLCILSVTAICRASVVTVNAANRITGDTIFVKDIASVEAPAVLNEKIGNIKIGSSPAPGKEKKIPVSLIKSRILSKLRPLNEKPQIRFSGEIVSVQRDYQILSKESLKQIFKEYIQNKLKHKKIQVRNIKVRGNKKLPAGRLKIELEPAKNKDIRGHFKLLVLAGVEAAKKERIIITGWVDRYEPVVYAKTAIKKGDILRENSLYSELTNITKAPSGVFNSISLVMGQVAKSGIRKNAMISSRMLKRLPDIKKGNMVKLVVKSGTLTVATFGLAMKDAQKGEQISVKNIKSKKLVTGRVVDSETVEVLF